MLKKKIYKYITIYREDSSERGRTFNAVFRNLDGEALGYILTRYKTADYIFESPLYESFESPLFEEVVEYIENKIKQ
jgi:hypothetical protein